MAPPKTETALRVAISLFLVVVGLVGLSLAQNPWHCDNTNAEEVQNNPIGTCACEGHLWVAPDCKEGFFCYNSTGYGCSLVSTRSTY